MRLHRSRHVVGGAAFALAAFIAVASPAWAQTVSLACSTTRGGEPAFFLTVNFDSGTVTIEGHGAYSARITDGSVIWDTPARNEDGAFFPSAHFHLFRASGELERSSSAELFPREYCRREERPAPVL